MEVVSYNSPFATFGSDVLRGLGPGQKKPFVAQKALQIMNCKRGGRLVPSPGSLREVPPADSIDDRTSPPSGIRSCDETKRGGSPDPPPYVSAQPSDLIEQVGVHQVPSVRVNRALYHCYITTQEGLLYYRTTVNRTLVEVLCCFKEPINSSR